MIDVEGQIAWQQWTDYGIFDDDGNCVEIQSIGRDITERKQKEKEVQQLSISDRLTDLYNKFYFEKQLKKYDADNKLPLSIIISNVNGLKLTNDAFGHQVGDELLIKFSKHLEISSIQLTDLILLAELHDIGKVAISESILKKLKPLTETEWNRIKEHPRIGYRIAKSSPELNSISKLILSHHEWWNGSGYPQGLKELEIPFLSQIITILDAYDVMTHGRPYQLPMDKEAALNELKDKAGIQFDPKLVKKFIELLK